MKITRTKEWLLLTVFTLFGIVVFSFLYYIFYGIVSTADDVNYTFKNVFPYSGETIPVFSNGPDTALTEPENRASIETANKIIMMAIHQARDIGVAAIIYRGLEGSKKFRIDVMISELDPEVFYPYRFDIRGAKKGFRLANTKFKLLSARKSYLHLQLVDTKASIIK